MKKAWMLLPVLLWAGIAYGQAVIQNGQPAGGNSRNQLQLMLGGGLFLSDTTGRAFSLDGDNTLYVTERYPDAYQTSSSIIMSLVSTTTAGKQVTAASNPYTAASINGLKWIRVTTAAGNAAAPWRLQWQGSQDGVTYYYLTTGSASQTNIPAANPVVPRGLTQSFSQDTTRTFSVFHTFLDGDTLQMYGHGAGSWWVPLNGAYGALATMKFLKCRAVIDTALDETAKTFTVEVQGRQY